MRGHLSLEAQPTVGLWDALFLRHPKLQKWEKSKEGLAHGLVLVKALECCGLDWNDDRSKTAFLSSVEKSWFARPSDLLLPGLQRALLESAPAHWWTAQEGEFQRKVIAAFPDDHRRKEITAQLKARVLEDVLPVSTPSPAPAPRF